MLRSRPGMGLRSIFSAALGLWTAHLAVAGQPNDNFADRIVLSGDDITFRGDLTGSTVEAGEPTSLPWATNFATHSVWWTWTATETKPVTIIALAYSEDTFTDRAWSAALAVYPGTNVFGATPVMSTNALWLDAAVRQLSISFAGVAGTSYQIQFFGRHPTLAVTSRLVAANAAVLLEPPRSQTTFPGGSALFTVLATGLSPASYQWRREGTDLPSKTSPVLALDGLAAEQAGAYDVVLSNLTGVTTSTPAMLHVTTTSVAPTLAATSGTDPNSFAFTLAGEEGRYYRIESSADLLNWSNETSFSSVPVALRYPPEGAPKGSVVFNATSNCSFSIPRGANARFLRASVYFPPDQICINHLKQIRFAKELWLRSVWPQPRNAVPAPSELSPETLQLRCSLSGPAGNIYSCYTVNDVLENPQCKISYAHVLEEP